MTASAANAASAASGTPSMLAARVGRQAVIMGRLLYLSAAWTLAIKYVLPVGWALWLGVPPGSFIYFWDAWWVAHIAVGWGLVHGRRGIWTWALLLALTEITIILAKFALFLSDPVLDFWRGNWFVNKCWLLGYFTFSLYWLSRPDVRLQLGADAGTREDRHA